MRRLLSVCFCSVILAALCTSDAARASVRYPPPGEAVDLSLPASSAPSSGPAAGILPRNALTMDQAAFALGTMTWNVIFPQSDGSVPNPDLWTTPEINTIKAKIAEAETHWEGLTSGFVPGARLSINVNYVNGGNPVAVPYDPSADESENWINSVMSQVGPYNSASRYTNVRNFNQDQRVAQGTNWATTLFVVHNTTYQRTSYAYAYLGGPFSVLENDSAGWGPQNFNMVLSHEMGHIFFALDEYPESGARTTDRSGYLNVQNLNASLDGNGNPVTPPQPHALMLDAGNYYTHVPFAPSPPTKEMVGFRDTDSDGIPNILDTAPSLTGNNAGSNPATGLFAFSGNVQVTTLANQNPMEVGFSNSRSAMTINTMSSSAYVLDGGAPVAIPAQDGAWGGYSENLGFTIPGLSAGPHTIDVYGVNSVGNASNALHFAFVSTVPEPASMTLLAAGALSLLGCWLRRRVRRG
jgi:hypothetical protein